MRKFVPCKVETAAVVGHAGTVKNMTPKKKKENAMKTKQLGQKDRQNKNVEEHKEGTCTTSNQIAVFVLAVYLKSKPKQKVNLLMTFVIGTKANDEWEGNEDGGVSGN